MEKIERGEIVVHKLSNEPIIALTDADGEDPEFNGRYLCGGDYKIGGFYLCEIKEVEEDDRHIENPSNLIKAWIKSEADNLLARNSPK